MAPHINLLLEEQRRVESVYVRVSLFRSTIVFFVFALVVSLGIWGYEQILLSQKQKLVDEIVVLNQKITSYKDVEERKSVLTIKTGEIESIYDNRFDFTTAIEDIEKLFVYSVSINSIHINSLGVVDVSGVKTGPIALSSEQAFSTHITELHLTLSVSSSAELEESVATLTSYLGKGLVKADIEQSQKTEEGYEVEFNITFGSNEAI